MSEEEALSVHCTFCSVSAAPRRGMHNTGSRPEGQDSGGCSRTEGQGGGKGASAGGRGRGGDALAAGGNGSAEAGLGRQDAGAGVCGARLADALPELAPACAGLIRTAHLIGFLRLLETCERTLV